MEETKELNALFKLIDDPDQEIYSTISDRIISYGKSVIPNLEHLWENTPNEVVQERIEMLIHSVHYRELETDFQFWANESDNDLFTGALLVCRYGYPDINTIQLYKELEKIRRNIWLELNQFLTSLEQVNVMMNILLNYYKLKSTEVSYLRPDDFLVHRVIDSKKGNAISMGILMLTLARLLDMNLHVINIPRQFIIGAFDRNYDPLLGSSFPPDHIHFYLDPGTGQIFAYKDVENYLSRIGITESPAHFSPMNNKQIIQVLLSEYAKCFEGEKEGYKKEELNNLSRCCDD